jgi:hypothetical protein
MSAINLREQFDAELEWFRKQLPKTRRKIEGKVAKTASDKRLRQLRGRAWISHTEADVGPIVAAPMVAFIKACQKLRKESGLSELPE